MRDPHEWGNPGGFVFGLPAAMGNRYHLAVFRRILFLRIPDS